MKDPLFEVYQDFLISSTGPATATNLAAMLEGEVSHDQITRMLSKSDWSGADLWRKARPLARRVQSQDAVLAVDDTILAKPHTDESKLVCWHFDHCQGRSVKGINFLTALYHSGGVSLPVGFAPVRKTEVCVDSTTGKEKRHSPVTKNELYRALLRQCVQNGLPFAHVVNDVWFASSENMMFVRHKLDKHFVMPLKSNRRVALSREDKAGGRWTALGEVAWKEGVAQTLWLEGVDFPLQALRQVFKNEGGSVGTLYLCGDDPGLSGPAMLKIYQRRWKIEEYHKSIKQNASLGKAPLRTVRTQINHILASLCAYTRLEGLKIKMQLNHFALKSRLYLHALKSAYAQLKEMIKAQVQEIASA